MTRKEYLEKTETLKNEYMKTWNKFIEFWERDELCHSIITEKDLDILGIYSDMFEMYTAQENIYFEDKDEIRSEELIDLFDDAYNWATGYQI